ncbi:MAG TPA: hypothetical protein VE524_05645 [Nitrososphaeraceae archaeon]|nr:hypothetical protein [Nitrososphaeraceae archaeon]
MTNNQLVIKKNLKEDKIIESLIPADLRSKVGKIEKQKPTPDFWERVKLKGIGESITHLN